MPKCPAMAFKTGSSTGTAVMASARQLSSSCLRRLSSTKVYNTRPGHWRMPSITIANWRGVWIRLQKCVVDRDLFELHNAGARDAVDGLAGRVRDQVQMEKFFRSQASGKAGINRVFDRQCHSHARYAISIPSGQNAGSFSAKPCELRGRKEKVFYPSISQGLGKAAKERVLSFRQQAYKARAPETSGIKAPQAIPNPVVNLIPAIRPSN